MSDTSLTNGCKIVTPQDRNPDGSRTFPLTLTIAQESALLASLIGRAQACEECIAGYEKNGNGKTAIADYWRRERDAMHQLLDIVRELGL